MLQEEQQDPQRCPAVYYNMSTTNGILDNGVLIPASNITWADLTDSPYGSWAQWTAWDGGNPKLPLTYVTDSVDFGRIDNINVALELDYSGTLTLTLQHSNDNTTFTDVSISASSTVAGFRARFVRFSFSIAGTDAQVVKILASLSNETQSETFQLTTSDLEGATSAREIDLFKNYSKIVAITGTAEASENYVATDYVATDYVETGFPLLLTVVDIDATDSAGELAPTIKLVDLSGNAQDGTVFVNVLGLPRMVSDAQKQITIQKT